jgi:cation diffusion facilitator family transporter
VSLCPSWQFLFVIISSSRISTELDVTQISESGTRSFSKLAEPARKGARITAIGIAVSVSLAFVKILSGVIGNAYALIADGVESILDVFSAAVVWGSLRIAASPPNERFPYGYGRIEPLAGLVVAITLLATALGIAIQSVREIFTPHHAPAPFTLIVLVLVVVAKEILFRRMLRAGDKIGSSAVKNDAWHHRSDAITSVAAFVGISIAVLKGKGYESADDWAALVACLVIAFNGVRMLRSSLAESLDAAPPVEYEEQVRSIAQSVDGVSNIEKCRVRKSGLGTFVELHVVVDGGVSVREGHRIGHCVKDALLAANLGILDVAVHVEPSDLEGKGVVRGSDQSRLGDAFDF